MAEAPKIPGIAEVRARWDGFAWSPTYIIMVFPTLFALILMTFPNVFNLGLVVQLPSALVLAFVLAAIAFYGFLVWRIVINEHYAQQEERPVSVSDQIKFLRVLTVLLVGIGIAQLIFLVSIVGGLAAISMGCALIALAEDTKKKRDDG